MVAGPCQADEKGAGAPRAVDPATPGGAGMAATGGFRPPDSCLKEFTPLRDETARRAKLIKAATEHRFAPGEACQLVHNYELAQTKMIDYAVAHASACGIPVKITDQLRANHENTLALMRKVCTVTWNFEPSRDAGRPVPSLVQGAANRIAASGTARL
jgi:hypothetical protein